MSEDVKERCIFSEFLCAALESTKSRLLSLISAEVRRLRKENESLRKQVQAALFDDLTGALARVAFDPLWDATMARLIRDDKHQASLAFIDIDHFKMVNDTHGHEAGDAALRHVAQVLKKACRPYDHLMRWGGEEFILLFDGANIHVTRTVLERIRQAVESTEMAYNGKVIPITVSIGFTMVTRLDSPELARERADHALYWAKGEGRNCVRGN